MFCFLFVLAWFICFIVLFVFGFGFDYFFSYLDAFCLFFSLLWLISCWLWSRFFLFGRSVSLGETVLFLVGYGLSGMFFCLFRR